MGSLLARMFHSRREDSQSTPFPLPEPTAAVPLAQFPRGTCTRGKTPIIGTDLCQQGLGGRECSTVCLSWVTWGRVLMWSQAGQVQGWAALWRSRCVAATCTQAHGCGTTGGEWWEFGVTSATREDQPGTGSPALCMIYALPSPLTAGLGVWTQVLPAHGCLWCRGPRTRRARWCWALLCLGHGGCSPALLGTVIRSYLGNPRETPQCPSRGPTLLFPQ